MFDIPQFLLNVEKLIDYASCNDLLIEINKFLDENKINVYEKNDSNNSKFKEFIRDKLKNHSFLCIKIAILEPNKYNLFKSPILKKYWDELWQDALVAAENTSNFYVFPDLHSMDMLISNFFLNNYIALQTNIRTQDRVSEAENLRLCSYLAHAAKYGRLPAIVLAAEEICNYLSFTKEKKMREELIIFFLNILKALPEFYLHIGHRFSGYYLIKLANVICELINEGITLSYDPWEYIEQGLKNFLIALKLENHLNIETEEDSIPRDNFFAKKNINNKMMISPELINSFKVINHNTNLDGYLNDDTFGGLNLTNYINGLLESCTTEQKINYYTITTNNAEREANNIIFGDHNKKNLSFK